MHNKEKKKFYKEYIQIYEKLISEFVTAVTTDVIVDQDIMRRIMHRAFLEMEQVDAKSDILNWMYMIASDEIVKAYKQKNEDYPFEYDEVKSKIDISKIFVWLCEKIDKAIYKKRRRSKNTTIFIKLNKLPFKNKLILLMRYMATLRKSDIAKLLSIDSEKIEDVLYDSLRKLVYAFGGDMQDVLIAAEVAELFEMYEDDDEDDEPIELTMEQKHFDDMLKFMIPRMYRENPRACAIDNGHSLAFIERKEFTNKEKWLFFKIRESITGDLSKNDFEKGLKNKILEDIAAMIDHNEFDEEMYNEIQNFLNGKKQKTKE